ncbi:MAG: hypothetical protein WBA76_00460 [Phormidesmis sp.]
MLRLFRRFFNLFRRSKRRSINAPALPPAEPLPPNEQANDRSDDQRNSATSPMPSIPPRKNQTKRSNIKQLTPVLNVLRAYVLTFGEPASVLELRSLIGAIVANVTTVEIENKDLEGFMDEAIAAFKSLGLEPSLVDVTAQLLAEQVSVWLAEQQTIVSNVISAYLQQFAPMDATWNRGEILSLVQTVVATLNDGSLSRSGGRVLVEKVVASFDLDRLLGQWVAPEWVALAQRVASYVGKGELQTEVRSIAWAYLQQFQAILSPQLIEQIIKTGPLNLSPADVLAGNFDDFSQMLYYKFQLLEADPVVTKSHEAIASDLQRAIADFQLRQGSEQDLSQGIQTGELEVSSPFGRTAS